MELNEVESIQYVGGPRNGKVRHKSFKDHTFPPPSIGCWDDIPLGSQVGLYKLDTTVNPPVLRWTLTRPGRIKTSEDPRKSSRG